MDHGCPVLVLNAEIDVDIRDFRFKVKIVGQRGYKIIAHDIEIA